MDGMVCFEGKKNVRQAKAGWTLSELLLALGILAILSIFVVPKLFYNLEDREWLAKVNAATKQICEAMEDGKQEHGLLPRRFGPYKVLRQQLAGSFQGRFDASTWKDVLGNSITNGQLPASGGSTGWSGDRILYNPPSVDCYTKSGRYTAQLKLNAYATNIAPDWPQRYLGQCVNLLCIHNPEKNRYRFVMLFRTSNNCMTFTSPPVGLMEDNNCLQPPITPTPSPG